MATYYTHDGNSANQYYFNSSTGSRSYPTGHLVNTRSPYQTIRVEQDDSYRYPQQHQSVAGFNKNLTQQYYQSAAPPPPQVRARVRSVGNSDAYVAQAHGHASPQHFQVQLDSRQQSGHSTGPAVVYQTPGAAQFTHHNVDLWTESPHRGDDHYAQAQRVSVRSVATGSPQQSHSISPSRHPDSLQQYYSQLTPEQHQQLLQRQQVSPASTHHQEQQRSAARAISGERPAQRIQVQEQSSQPVGIRNLMNKFAGPTPSNSSSQQRSRSTSSRHYSTSTYTSSRTNTASKPANLLYSKMPLMTYSALPKPHEPPVNSVEYYQMQMQQFSGQGIPDIQQAAAPEHIKHHHQNTGLGGLRDRFTMESLPRQAPPPSPTNKGQGNTLSSLRHQYMHRTNETNQNDNSTVPPAMQHIPRTIIGEDYPPKTAPQSKVMQPPVNSQVYQGDKNDAPAAAQSNDASETNAVGESEF